MAEENTSAIHLFCLSGKNGVYLRFSLGKKIRPAAKQVKAANWCMTPQMPK